MDRLTTTISSPDNTNWVVPIEEVDKALNLKNHSFVDVWLEPSSKGLQDGLEPKILFKGLKVKEIKNELTMSDEAWYVIRNTRGVTGFVGPESKPIPLTDSEAIALGVEIRSVEVNYDVGDFVRIAYGTMEGSLGIVEEIDKNENVVTVKITMLSREVQVKLELDQVELVVD